MIGDFNIDLLLHHNHLPTHNFLTTIQSLNHFIHISRPTRFPQGNQSGDPALLDHLYTNFHGQFKAGILHYPISDHLPIFINIALPSQNIKSNPSSKTQRKTYRVFSETNKVNFKQQLIASNWNDIINPNDDVSANTERVLNHLNSIYNLCFPLKSKDISLKRIQCPWITDAVLKSIRTKNKLFRDFKVGAISDEQYKLYRNNLTKVVRTAKREYYVNYFNDFKNSTKKIWTKIKELQGIKANSNQTKSFKIDGKLNSNRFDIANAFNQFYTSIASNIEKKLPKSNINPLSYLRGEYLDSMVVPEVLIEDTIKVIKSLKDKNDMKSIPTSLIKANDSLIAIPLTLLFNQSISSGSFPQCLKHAEVIPLYKKGPKDDIENYRPISLLPVFSKIFESLMKTFLINYLTSKAILCTQQFGFRKGLSTLNALDVITSDLNCALDQHDSAICVFIDFQKAFDTVPHNLLLQKMEHYGIRGVIHDWFKSYLTHRTQSTIFEKSASSPLPISHGVPQGSILGPILFLIFINDISNVFSKFKVVLFADDSSFYIIGKDLNVLVTQANSELDKFYEWTVCNRLSVHLDKTKYLVFSNKKYQKLFPLFFHFNMLQQCTYHKVLGLTIDDKLSFKFHIQDVCGKLSRSISLIYNLKEYMPIHVLITVYYAHIQPYFSYCLPIWGSTYPTHLQSLFLIQKRAIRLINNKPYLEHTNPLFKQTKIIKFFDFVKLEIASYMYKNRNSDSFHRLVHNYNTRHRNVLLPQNHSLSLFQRSLQYNGPSIWNSIAQNIKGKNNLRLFRKHYKSYLLLNY